MNINRFPKIIKFLLWPFTFIGVNIYMWSKLPFALLPHPEIKKGDKFMVLEEIMADVLTHFAPHLLMESNVKFLKVPY
jgi:hypothetical protein